MTSHSDVHVQVNVYLNLPYERTLIPGKFGSHKLLGLFFSHAMANENDINIRVIWDINLLAMYSIKPELTVAIYVDLKVW